MFDDWEIKSIDAFFITKKLRFEYSGFKSLIFNFFF
jgi:hypothetical protein